MAAADPAAATAATTSGLVLGLNGAFQRRVVLRKELVVGAVNRGKTCSTGVGGKGQGAFLAAAAAAACSSSRSVKLWLAQFVGGDEGKSLARALRLRGRDMDERLWISTCRSTRMCTTLVDSDEEATEIVEPSSLVEGSEVAKMIDEVKRVSPVDGLLCSGSLPPGIDGYGDMIQAARPRLVLLLDTVIFDDEILKKKFAKWTILKLNAREVLKAANADDPAVGNSDSKAPRPAKIVAVAAKSLCERHGFDVVLWTDGPFDAGAYVFSRDARFSFVKDYGALPGPILSPIGAGDTVAGITFVHFLERCARLDYDRQPSALLHAFSYGLSCGAASCLTPDNALFDPKVADTLPYRLVEQAD